jgi:RNA polymerase sigma factor (sigma-70 family)
MGYNLDAIIQKVRNGEKEQFRHLISHCNQPLYRTAIVILKNESDAEDAMQSAYLKAFAHLNSFKGEATFLTWITRILINECKMLLRKRRNVASLDNEEVLDIQSNIESAVDQISKQQLHKWLEKSIIDLPEKYRLVYITREVNEMSTEETASTLGLSEENVKVRLHRAKSLIRESLMKNVRSEELFSFGSKRCEALADRVMRNLESERTVIQVYNS